MGVLDYVYAIQVYLLGVWNYIFSYSVDNSHSSVFRMFQQPIFAYSVGGIPIYAYIMMFVTISILAIVTIMEKGVIPGETAPLSAEPAPPATVGGAGISFLSKVLGGKKRKHKK